MEFDFRISFDWKTVVAISAAVAGIVILKK